MEPRSTFRDPVKNKAWQKQLRDRYESEGCPVSELSLKKAVVRKVSRAFAEQIILKYEWLGTMATTNYHYGIFWGMHCAGVCCYAVGNAGAGVNVPKEWGLTPWELAYLARGANVHWSPSGANSKLVSLSAKMLHKETGVKMTIAYSDTDAGEIGTIYQACNWVCVGRGSSTRQWISPEGRVYDQKHPSNLRASDNSRMPRRYYVEKLKRAGWIEQDSNPKYRYVFLLDKKNKRLAQLIKSKETPYPKR